MTAVVPSENDAPIGLCTKDKQTPNQDKLVDAAIKFLRNSQVQSKPLSHKKAFLRTKGLSEQQIERAVFEAGSTESLSNPMQIRTSQQRQIHVPVLKRIQNASFVIVIVCGAGYGLYLFYRNFIKPYLDEKKEDSRNLNESVKELEKTIKALQDTLRENQNKIKDVLQNNNRNSPREFQELKAEINSLKALMLNRNSFPLPPNFIGSGIPAWQLQQENNDSNNDSNNGSNGEEQVASGRSWEVVNEESEGNNPQK